LPACHNSLPRPGDPGRFIAVKLRVDDITAEAREHSFAEPEQEINRALDQGAVREYRIGAPIQVSISCYRAGTELFLSGQVEAIATASCARCAEEFSAATQRPFRYVLAPKSLGYNDEQADLRADDLEFSLYEGDEVDLAPLIREQVLLALAARPLCREDCRGLCPRCGANLNEGECGCRTEAGDSRLSVLRTIKAGR
jgi:uncharacterized protein